MKDESASFISERPPLHASSSDLPAFILPTFRPSSFILHPSSFRPSSFILPAFILHPSSFILPAFILHPSSFQGVVDHDGIAARRSTIASMSTR
ncbi:MAG: hypothetical protein ACXW28_13365, partial [Thermoanaerobaculia bacterium]